MSRKNALLMRTVLALTMVFVLLAACTAPPGDEPIAGNDPTPTESPDDPVSSEDPEATPTPEEPVSYTHLTLPTKRIV